MSTSLRPRNVASFGVSRCLFFSMIFSSIVFFPIFRIQKKEQSKKEQLSSSRFPVPLGKGYLNSVIFLIQHFYFIIKRQSNGARLVLEMFKHTVYNIRLQYLYWSHVGILDANWMSPLFGYNITGTTLPVKAFRHCNSATEYTIPLNDSQLTSQHNYSTPIQSTTACLRETTIVAES